MPRRPTEDPTTDDRYLDDRALADAVLGGDRDAFRALVEREAPVVLGVCRRILGDPAEAEDAAQEAFLIAFRRLGSYRGDGPLGGWVTRIALRAAQDRVNHRRPAVSLEVAEERATTALRTSGHMDPAAHAEARERVARVRAAIAELPAQYRDAIRLRYLEDRSFSEIAAATGRPEPTIRSHVHRGLARLRDQLADEGAI